MTASGTTTFQAGHHAAHLTGVSGALLPSVVGHLAIAVSSYVRRLRHDGYAVPREVDDLASVLCQLARARLEPPSQAMAADRIQHGPMPDRLLVTKAEAADRLGVSVRTVERLAAAGRLPLVHVERAVRFRVRDLQTFVDGLTEHLPSRRLDGSP